MSEKLPKDRSLLINRLFLNLQQWSEKNKYHADGSLVVKKSELELALTLLLVDLASSDQHGFDPAEHQTIIHGLQRVFGTTPLQAERLINQALMMLKNLRGSDSYAELLKKHLSEGQRVAIMEIVDQVIEADEIKDGFELYLKRRISQILEIVCEKKLEED